MTVPKLRNNKPYRTVMRINQTFTFEFNIYNKLIRLDHIVLP